MAYTVDTAPIVIEAYAVKYGIEAGPLKATLKCESGFNPNAVGDHGTSYGVAQIHLPAHKDITKEEALNPFFAIDYAAQQFKAGNQGIWSCYRKISNNTG